MLASAPSTTRLGQNSSETVHSAKTSVYEVRELLSPPVDDEPSDVGATVMACGIEVLTLATNFAMVEHRDRQALLGIDGFDDPAAVRSGDE